MDIVEVLIRKKVKVREINGWGSYLRHQWEEQFVSHLNKEDKKAIYLHYDDGACGYLWHVFSYEKRQHLIGPEADRAFNKVLKQGCFVFYQHSDYALMLEDASQISAADFIEKDNWNQEDVYIVDKGFTWTYVHTHEEQCGPYFSSL